MQHADHHEQFQRCRVRQACRALHQGHPGEQLLHRLRDRHVELGHHPDGSALEDGQVACDPRRLGDQLHRGRTGSDHRDALVGEVGGVVPVGGVQDRALEGVDPREVGDVGLGEEAGGGHQIPARACRAVIGVHHPELLLLIPFGGLDADAELHVPCEIVGVGDVRRVAFEFGARREQSRPVGVRRERVRVGHRGDVDGQARVVVHMPGATEVVLAFEDCEVVDAETSEFDGRPEPTESGAHDDHLVMWSHVPSFARSRAREVTATITCYQASQ